MTDITNNEPDNIINVDFVKGEVANDAASDLEGKSAMECVSELAAMDPLVAAQHLKTYAKHLKISVGDLRGALKVFKKQQGEVEEAKDPEHWKVEPWGEPVDGAALAADIMDAIGRYVVLTHEQKVGITLWVMLSWVHNEIATHSPFLMLSSPEHGCGKSTLLFVLSYLVRKGEMTVEITGATLFRGIEKWGFTLLMDEVETLFHRPESTLPALMNSGWIKGSTVIRCHGENNEAKRFKTFSPKVFALIGQDLPATILSRSIIVEMERKLAGDKAEYFDCLDKEEFVTLRRKCLRWAADNMDTLKKANPDIPPTFENRLGANWRLQFAIADLTGWGAEARTAAQVLAGVVKADDASVRAKLLQDIYSIFVAQDKGGLSSTTALKSSVIVELLGEMENRRWAEWKGGRPITQTQLAALLKPFKTEDGNHIEPKLIDFGSGRDRDLARGYERHWFRGAFRRYLGIEDGAVTVEGAFVTPCNRSIFEVLQKNANEIKLVTPVTADSVSGGVKLKVPDLEVLKNGTMNGKGTRVWETEGYRKAHKERITKLAKEHRKEIEEIRLSQQVEAIRNRLRGENF